MEHHNGRALLSKNLHIWFFGIDLIAQLLCDHKRPSVNNLKRNRVNNVLGYGQDQ